MSILSMTAIIAFMILGGAVMMSALVDSSAQMLISPFSVGGAALAAVAGRAGRLLLVLALQLGREILGVGVAQVAHAGVAAFLQGRVEVRDQGPQPQPLVLVAADEHAVGALVGDQRGGRRGAALRLRALAEGRDHPHDLRRGGVLQPDHLEVRRCSPGRCAR